MKLGYTTWIPREFIAESIMNFKKGKQYFFYTVDHSKYLILSFRYEQMNALVCECCVLFVATA